MLRYPLTHPQILHALASAGHGSTVLIADGNYPFKTGSFAGAERVFLNLTRGWPTTTDVLRVLTSAIPIEAAHVMQPADGNDAPIFTEFRELLPGIDLQSYDRFTFYEAARKPDLALCIATGEQRVYANILLTIGVVPQ